ncbi:hypothetical protein GQS52_19870 [Streptomyces sp. SCUT-3]|uniref:hypothetical protein n=2 Tax=unclassified Streptomyces TaxID=2593676 RepID=UPI0015F8EB4A|nr:hypothetical protein [Streptomyces sp. SCUT-3]QMV23657.1 hypothetical protein GQS52_19870 [Streptomyces sp. SCUT-3]
MTACVTTAFPRGETLGRRDGPAPAAGSGAGARGAGRAGFSFAADGSYAACLAPGPDGTGPHVERWTLDGPEPYTVPLPGARPEGPGSEVAALPDGRVLIRRPSPDGSRHHLALLHPTGPRTGELPLGSLAGTEVRLLPPPPVQGPGAAADLVFALARHGDRTTVWLVHDGRTAGVPRPVASVDGRCTGGVWLDRTARLLAVDRHAGDGPGTGGAKTVVVDLATGAVTPLLQLTPDSDDRLLLADPDSGLLVLRSDAPGTARLGWGVLGSRLPVRFPDCLAPPDVRLTPFAVQPGEALAPEAAGVALRVDGPQGTGLAVWRPAERRLRQLPAPRGWLAGAGRWTPHGLCLPFFEAEGGCGVAVPADPPAPGGTAVPGTPSAATGPAAPAAPAAPVGPATPAAPAPTVGGAGRAQVRREAPRAGRGADTGAVALFTAAAAAARRGPDGRRGPGARGTAQERPLPGPGPAFPSRPAPVRNGTADGGPRPGRWEAVRIPLPATAATAGAAGPGPAAGGLSA